MKFKVLMFVALFATISSTAVFAEDKAPSSMTIITGYGGVITNEFQYEKYKMKEKDSGLMTGLYLQYVDPKLLQVNGFFYYAPDTNYSKVTGIHLNGDGYFLQGEWGSLVAGVDIEKIKIRMDAGSNFQSKYKLEDFRFDNDVLFMMVRTGVRINALRESSASVSVFPYVGVTRETVEGTVWADPAPPIPVGLQKATFSDTDWYPSFGVNLTGRFFHVVELSAKYLGRAQKDNYMNSYTGQLNVYVTTFAVVSYQFKYMELGEGFDAYHIFGAGIVF
jgi:hypothetical protein